MNLERTYDVDLNKLVDKTFKFLRNNDVPKHFSKTKNEKYDLHLMLVLYVLFCLADKSLRRFRRLIESCPPTILKLKHVPSISTMNRTWRRISPKFLRELVQLSGKGGRDKCVALDPTLYFLLFQTYLKKKKQFLLQWNHHLLLHHL